MARLPQPGGDDGKWGQILNDFLSQTHNLDGSLKAIDVAKVTGLAPVATSGSYTDLTNQPTIPDVSSLVTGAALDSKNTALVEDVSSQTSGALKTALGPYAVLEVHDRFSNLPDGTAPARASTGQLYGYWPVSGANRLRIVGGKLTFAGGTAGAAGYAYIECEGPVTRVGGSWTFGPATTPNGAAGLLAFAGDIGASYDAGDGVPDSPCHFTIAPTAWTYSVWEGGVIREVDSGSFSPALATDSTTVHTGEVVIDRLNSTAHVTLPNGSMIDITDPSIGSIEARWATLEPYQYNGPTDSLVAYTDWWADSRQPTPVIEMIRVKAAAAPASRVALAAPASRQTVTLSSTGQEISTELRQTVTFPESGRVQVEVDFHAQVIAGSWLIVDLAVDAGLTPVLALTCYGDDGADSSLPAYRGPLHAVFVYAGSPGMVITFYFAVRTPYGGGSVVIDPSYGYAALSRITPLAA